MYSLYEHKLKLWNGLGDPVSVSGQFMGFVVDTVALGQVFL